MTRDEATQIVGLLFGAWARNPSEATMMVYAELLVDIDYDIAKAAMRRVVCDGAAHPPNAGMFRQECLRATRPDLFVSTAEAWREVQAGIGRFGAKGKPNWSTQIIAEAVRKQGWQTICASSELGYERAYFCRVYDELLTKAKANAANGRLAVQARITAAAPTIAELTQ